MIPSTATNQGLHDFVADHVLARYARPGGRAADLGGPGAMGARLHLLGCEVLAVDRNGNGFEAGLQHASLSPSPGLCASSLSLFPGRLSSATTIFLLSR